VDPKALEKLDFSTDIAEVVAAHPDVTKFYTLQELRQSIQEAVTARKAKPNTALD
jgi:hypothetical protein